MDLGLKDAAVCVQGGTKGMGRAAAERFAADGARVVVLARGQEATMPSNVVRVHARRAAALAQGGVGARGQRLRALDQASEMP